MQKNREKGISARAENKKTARRLVFLNRVPDPESHPLLTRCFLLVLLVFLTSCAPTKAPIKNRFVFARANTKNRHFAHGGLRYVWSSIHYMWT